MPTISGPRDDQDWEGLLGGAKSGELRHFGGALRGLICVHVEGSRSFGVEGLFGAGAAELKEWAI